MYETWGFQTNINKNKLCNIVCNGTHCRTVAIYLKVVRRREASSAREGENTRGGGGGVRGGGGLGPPPRIFLNFERFYVRF